jgi:hypothetical protein
MQDYFLFYHPILRNVSIIIPSVSSIIDLSLKKLNSISIILMTHLTQIFIIWDVKINLGPGIAGNQGWPAGSLGGWDKN